MLILDLLSYAHETIMAKHSKRVSKTTEHILFDSSKKENNKLKLGRQIYRYEPLF